MLFQVNAPHFVAGLIVDEDTMKVTRAANVIRWMEGRSISIIETYCKIKKWSITYVVEDN